MNEERHRPAPIACLVGEIRVGEIYLLPKPEGTVQMTVTAITPSTLPEYTHCLDIRLDGDNGKIYRLLAPPSTPCTLSRLADAP